MIFKDLLGNTPISDVSIEIQHNLEDLFRRVQLVECAYGYVFRVTSGLRSMQDHLRIYSEINARRIKRGLKPLSVPMKSNHLTGRAVDISDPGHKIHAWCKANEGILDVLCLWCEEKDQYERVHFQTIPPKSGKRFFYP